MHEMKYVTGIHTANFLPFLFLFPSLTLSRTDTVSLVLSLSLSFSPSVSCPLACVSTDMRCWCTREDGKWVGSGPEIVHSGKHCMNHYKLVHQKGVRGQALYEPL